MAQPHRDRQGFGPASCSNKAEHAKHNLLPPLHTTLELCLCFMPGLENSNPFISFAHLSLKDLDPGAPTQTPFKSVTDGLGKDYPMSLWALCLPLAPVPHVPHPPGRMG